MKSLFTTLAQASSSEKQQKMNEPLIIEFTYKAAKAEVWSALTETEKMKIWYFPQLKKFELKVGYEFQFDDSDAEYQKKWTVTRIEKENTFAHNWAYKGHTGESEVIFSLFFDEDETTIRVTQTGIESFPDDPHFKRERFERGWNNLLGNNLKQLLENQHN